MARRSTDAADYQEVPSPVAAMPKEFVDGHYIVPHRHRRAQVVHAITGTMRLSTETGAWVVPPRRAVWVPGGIEHEIRMVGPVSMRTLYIEPDAAPFMPEARCVVVEVSPLLRELILAMGEQPLDGAPDRRAEAMIGLILDELRRATALPVSIPLPSDLRLLALCREMLDDLAAEDTLEAWAERLSVSGRTLARLFRRETGLSFGAWRQQARVAEAIGALSRGRSIAEVADSLGYDSPSAFTAMFRRVLGEAPSRYVRREGLPLPAPSVVASRQPDEAPVKGPSGRQKSGPAAMPRSFSS
ncbi:MAG: AraC family transcriptional regulator [Alphaproteobacteria bacterium]|nr:AraC family transcriptional regulator [Alphaproteobacteria bacterium]